MLLCTYPQPGFMPQLSKINQLPHNKIHKVVIVWPAMALIRLCESAGWFKPCWVLHEPRHEKTCFLHCENKGADQLRSNCAADQHLCFRYIDNTIPLLPISEISSLWPSSVIVQPAWCQTWSKTLRQVLSSPGSYVIVFVLSCGGSNVTTTERIWEG